MKNEKTWQAGEHPVVQYGWIRVIDGDGGEGHGEKSRRWSLAQRQKHIEKGLDFNIVIPLDLCGGTWEKSLVLETQLVNSDLGPDSRLQYFLAIAA